MIEALEKPQCVAMPNTAHHFSDGLYAKELVIPKDMGIVQHSHKYAHLSILAKGRVIVISDDKEQEYKAPACIEIKAGVHHKVISLEDAIWYCIHATEETDADKVDEVLIARG